jgi:hypothetical protein
MRRFYRIYLETAILVIVLTVLLLACPLAFLCIIKGFHVIITFYINLLPR